MFAFNWHFTGKGEKVKKKSILGSKHGELQWVIFKDRVSTEGNAVGSVCLSVHLFVSTLSLELTDR